MRANRLACGWVLVVLAIFLAVVVGGCNRPYVNIPPLAGSVASADPNSATVRKVEVAALRAVLAQTELTEAVTIILPAQTATLSYEQVVAQVSDLAIWSDQPDPEVAPLTLTVKAVRVRSMTAQVDITISGEPRSGRLVTAHLKWEPFSGWMVRRLHSWGVIDDASLSVREQPPAQSP